MSRRIAWYAAALAGALPALLVGAAASAFSNKVLFALWGLFAASLYVVFLRWGFVAAWNPWFTAGRSLLILAFSVTLLGRLVARYGEDLDLGARAMLGTAYRPAMTQLQSVYTSAIVLAVAGTLCVLVGRGSTSSLLRRPSPPQPLPRGPLGPVRGAAGPGGPAEGVKQTGSAESSESVGSEGGPR